MAEESWAVDAQELALRKACCTHLGVSDGRAGIMQCATLPRIFSGYDDTPFIKEQVRSGKHRDVVGGLWEELGALQLEFLIAQGLRPEHMLIDIGAGSFRAGVKLVPYLDPGNYCAIDSQASLMEAGYVHEIRPAGLCMRFPRGNFLATADFNLLGFERFFDYGLAQSVFTHMPLSRLLDCLFAIAPFIRSGGSLFATVFMADEAEAAGPVTQFPGIVTYPDHDPFHTTAAALRALASRAPLWRITIIGAWHHPRNQHMVRFERILGR